MARRAPNSLKLNTTSMDTKWRHPAITTVMMSTILTPTVVESAGKYLTQLLECGIAEISAPWGTLRLAITLGCLPANTSSLRGNEVR